MARKPATADNTEVGSIVYTSRTGQVKRRVVGFDTAPCDPQGQTLVVCARAGYMDSWFTFGELWV